MKKKAYIRTFGCQMNVHDSEKMAGLLEQGGYEITNVAEGADLIVFNTCSIRQKAEQKFMSELGLLRQAKIETPGLKIAVAGCIAQQRGMGIIKRAPFVDFVLGPQNIHSLSLMLDGSDKGRVATDSTAHVSLMEQPTRRDPSDPRAWVSIMYGCDNYCTYCIVPYTRGREVSRPSRNIIEEVKGLVRNMVREVTLLGQNVNSYMSDIDFPQLLSELNAIEGLERIRFVTNHPRDLSEAMVESMARLDKVCEAIHLPLQSGSDRVLKAMNRRYKFVDYMDKVKRLRAALPDIVITTDIIAGFPTETEEEHQETLAALREVRYDGIFAFAYSPRPGTKAADMEGQLPGDVKLRRLREVLDTQDLITSEINQKYPGQSMEVLVEGLADDGSGRIAGRTRGNKIVLFNAEIDGLKGRVVKVQIDQANRHSLSGKLA